MTLSAVEQFHAIAFEMRPPIVVVPTLTVKPKRSAFLVFVFITLTYVLCEFVYNKTLLSIASGTPSTATMDAIEWAGRTMAGVGCAIVVWRARMAKKAIESQAFPWRGFAMCVGLSIPAMWLAQEVVIQAIVKNASPATLRAATVSIAGRQALLEPASTSKIAVGEEVVEEAKERIDARIMCKQTLDWMSNQNLGSKSKALWAMFGVITLNAPKTQHDLRTAIAKAVTCAIEKSPSTVKAQHARYVRETAAFVDLKLQYESASRQVTEYEKSRWSSKSRTEAMWRQNADKFFGFSTTISWGLAPAAFDRHPDVARLVGQKAGVGMSLPLGLDFDGFKRALTESGLAPMDASESTYWEGGEFQKVGEEAYKAALVPLIGLSLSLFFGFYNATMLGLSAIAHLAKRTIRLWPSILVAATIACLPTALTSPLARTPEYKAALAQAWKDRPFMATFLAWTVPAESIIE